MNSFPCDIFSNPAVQADAYAAVANAAPAILTVAITGPTAANSGQAVAFSATVTGAPTGTVLAYSWGFGDSESVVSGTQTVSHTYAVAGTYSVNVRAKNNATGAEASATMTIVRCIHLSH